MTDKSDLEIKAVTGEIGTAFDEFMRTFEAFKESNDERLSQMERKTEADPVTTEKLQRIDQALDQTRKLVDGLALKAARPSLGGRALSGATLEHARGFQSYVRKGDEQGLRALEQKALSVGSDPDGGYLVPDETERVINARVRDVSPIRAIAGVRQVSGTVYKKPIAISGADSGWVGETAVRPETNAPTLSELSYPTMELYAMPAATSTLLDDSAVNIDEWLAEEIQSVFAEQEGKAFVTGDGVNKPTGFLSYPTADQSSWSWGNIGTIATGVSGAFPASDPSDKLIDVIYSVKAGYRGNAHFVMNRATQSEIRKMKDADGNYLWSPAQAPGQAPTLLGYPVSESEDMPDIAADSLSLAFGDFSRGYLIVDRVGIRVLRDPYTSKPYVLFYTTKRVGGGVQDFDAIKLLKFGV